MGLEKIKEIIKQKKIKQVDLARSVRITPEQLSRYIHGKQVPSYEIVCKIAKALNVKVEKIAE